MRIISWVILLSVFIISCNRELTNNYKYAYNNEFIHDTILLQIENGIIGTKHKFILNEKLLKKNEIKSKISLIKKEDIISIQIIDKAETIKKYSPKDKDGIVKINFYIDSLLKPEYYNITNSYILYTINDLISHKSVVRYPLIVLDGKPLRGKDIKDQLDNFKNELIKSILIMNLESGLQLYGERAINGVVIINTLFD